MSLLRVSELTFCYEGSFDNIFEKVSFSIDTDWKTGFIGRNGKGKTTFLRLLMGEYDYEGSIATDKTFDYFPYEIKDSDWDKTVDELCEEWKPGVENWRIICELGNLGVDPEVLYRPIRTLSQGERTKTMIAVLFSGENEFLLIDEPTNHLDIKGRDIIRDYLKSKKGFILVSHDRNLLDAVSDHMLVLNRESIEVMSGNFSTWQENKERADAFAIAENEKHMKEIGKLKTSADRAGRWADKNENTKIGFDPIKEHDRIYQQELISEQKQRKCSRE
jgi:ATPase components of ABC transporters with duplicated ATPase domains